MKLEAVNIQNFRSIQGATLEKCGSFNVIIGKNNAGKSNTLFAIDAFFKVLKEISKPDSRKVVDTPINFHPIDFHQNLVKTPIEITIFFQLSPDERSDLIEDLVSNLFPLEESYEFAPQLSIALVVKVYTPEFPLEESAPEVFAYLNEIVVCESGCSTLQEDTIVWTYFKIDSIKQNMLAPKYAFNLQNMLVPEYAFNLIKQISEMNVLYLTERREPIEKDQAKQLLALTNRQGGKKKFRAIQEIVTALLGVEIDAFLAKEISSGKDPEAELDVDQFLVQVNGAGIREALRLILDYELKKPNILLVEEPEIHLHPALETIMMRYLKSIGEKCQIFITTHSTNFLDTAEMRNVYLASCEGREGSTNIQLVNLDKEEQIILRELGIRLSSVFMYDTLVFVEGPTDVNVIREWASICGVNLAQASVGFVPMEGVRNLSYYAGEATINLLAKRRVSVFFIIDRDEREEHENDKLLKQIRDRYEREEHGNDKLSKQIRDRVKLIVLKKRELENYFLCLRAISKFIKEKRLEDKSQSTTKEWQRDIDIAGIEQAIDTCAEQLKDVVIERRVRKIACNPIYLDRDPDRDNPKPDSGTTLVDRLKEEYAKQKNALTKLEGELEKTIEKETRFVEANWKTNKLDIVPGDLLLDKVCQLFGVRFKKNKDSVKLASLMEENEIDVEIRELLTSLAAFTLTI